MKQRIRQQMILHPKDKLWDKDFAKWTKPDFNHFYLLENDKPKLRKMRKKMQGVEVVRIADNKAYLSITACRIENNFCKAKMYNLLNEGSKFKRVPMI